MSSDRTAIPIDAAGLHKRFGRYPALNGVDLSVAPGELVALLGPSGSGKTTLLRLMAGLDFPDAGVVRFGGEDVTYTPAAKRGVGFVFQQYALFKHMTVARNIAFGLDVQRRSARPDRAAKRARVEELLALVQLEGYGARFPAQLSGGQRQRVALARALAVSPRVLLLDEPFGALDATVRKTLRHELRRIHDATGLTTVFVTHDQEEALGLADRVAVLNHGRLEQVGRPQAVLDAPASPFVAGFVGEANRLEGEVRGGAFHFASASLIEAEAADGPAVAYVRPDQLQPAALDEPALEVIVGRVLTRGPLTSLDCTTLAGQPLTVAVVADRPRAFETGAVLRLAIRKAYVFPLS